MIKAISTVIASILMLMIVIALGGTTYLYVSGVFTGRTATAFELIDSVNDTVTIRNTGTDAIASFGSFKVGANDAIYRIESQDSSLVGYWKLDENAGSTAFDSSQQKNNGNLVGNPVWTVGRFGNALNFDGNDKVTVPNNPSLQMVNDFTIAFWVKLATVQPSGDACCYNPLSKGHDSTRGWTFQAIGSSMAFLAGKGDSIPGFGFINPDGSPKNLRDNTWHHLAIVKSSTKGTTTYLDGKINNPQPTFTYNVVGADVWDLTIGADTANDRNIIGLVDDVKIWNRPLNDDEINSEYNIGGMIRSGSITTIKIYNTLSKGTHTLRFCTSSMCNTAILTII